MPKIFAPWWLLVKAATKAAVSSRKTFAISIGSSIVVSLLEVSVYLLLVSKALSFAGWSISDVYLVFGITSLGFGIADLLLGHLEGVGAEIRDGSFDRYLLRPGPSLLHAATADFVVRRFGRLLQGAVALTLGVSSADRPLLTLIAAAWATLCAALVYCGLLIVAASLAFWVGPYQQSGRLLTYGSSAVGSYPVVIFPVWLRVLAFGLVPVAVPSSGAVWALRNHHMPILTSLAAAELLAGICMVALSIHLWNGGVRNYASPGS